MDYKDGKREWEYYVAQIKRIGAGKYGTKLFMCAKYEHWKILWAAEELETLQAKVEALEGDIPTAEWIGFIIFKHMKGANLIDPDWDSGAILGKDDVYREKIMACADELRALLTGGEKG